jgi:hypothetical protein
MPFYPLLYKVQSACFILSKLGEYPRMKLWIEHSKNVIKNQFHVRFLKYDFLRRYISGRYIFSIEFESGDFHGKHQRGAGSQIVFCPNANAIRGFRVARVLRSFMNHREATYPKREPEERRNRYVGRRQKQGFFRSC